MVDPLFKKTSADFDEGTASGLLLNHLSITDQGRIIFDSSDAALPSGSDEATNDEKSQTETPKEMISLGKLKGQLISCFRYRGIC
jgi:condensin complex subunit 2